MLVRLMRYFDAVGGRVEPVLKGVGAWGFILVFLQIMEYSLTFRIIRPLWQLMDATILMCASVGVPFLKNRGIETYVSILTGVLE